MCRTVRPSRPSGRLEVRSDPESEELISAAAAAQSVSVVPAFLVDVARGAGRILGCANPTLMLAEEFDAMVPLAERAGSRACPQGCCREAAAGQHR
jgi:uncharacterized protein (DUF1778 family)